MKTKIKVGCGSQLPYEAPLNRFAHDFLGFAIGRLDANIESPSVGVIIVPDDDWWSRLGNVIEPFQGLPNWKEATAAVVYVSSTLEDRVRLAHEIQRIRKGEYDRFVDYCALIFLRRPEPGDKVQATTQIYYGIAASCIRLLFLAVARSLGVGVVVGYESAALKMMNDFLSTMTPDEFAARYAPEVA